jgi:hypothetical protein
MIDFFNGLGRLSMKVQGLDRQPEQAADSIKQTCKKRVLRHRGYE